MGIGDPRFRSGMFSYLFHYEGVQPNCGGGGERLP